jgi:hypothetical protein
MQLIFGYVYKKCEYIDIFRSTKKKIFSMVIKPYNCLNITLFISWIFNSVFKNINGILHSISRKGYKK